MGVILENSFVADDIQFVLSVQITDSVLWNCADNIVCCGISKFKQHLQSDMKHIYLLLDVLNEGDYSAIILNFVKALQSFCFLAYSKLACNFQRHQVLFVKYIINGLLIDSPSFIK